MNSPTLYILEDSNFDFSMSGYMIYVFYVFLEKNKLFAGTGDPDQMPYSAVSDLGLHCLPITLWRVSNGLILSSLSFWSGLFLLRIWSDPLFQIGVSVKNQNRRLMSGLFSI